MENMYLTSRGSRSTWHLTADAAKNACHIVWHTRLLTPSIILLLLLFSSPVKILKNNSPDGKSLIISENQMKKSDQKLSSKLP